MAVHKKCHDKIMGKCPGSGRESESTIVSAFLELFFTHLFVFVFCVVFEGAFQNRRAAPV